MISEEEVKHIAKLARLKLEEPEIEKMQKDMAAILDYFKIIQSADLKSQNDNQKLKMKENVVRQDVPVKNNEVGDLILAAPDTKDGYIKVKQVL